MNLMPLTLYAFSSVATVVFMSFALNILEIYMLCVTHEHYYYIYCIIVTLHLDKWE